VGALKVNGVCRLGANPELKFTPNGAAVCSARAIFQDRYMDRQTNEWKDGQATWVTLTAWRQLAENMAESFKKGDDVVVLDGALTVREYDLRDGGGKGYSVDITVRDLGPSIRFHAAQSQRVDRQYDGPAAGPVDDPWTYSGGSGPARGPDNRTANGQSGHGAARETRREAGRWIGSGEQVATPTGGYPDEPPF
jgi:single-strand DNA-binding protein